MPPALKLEDYKKLANKKGFIFTLKELPKGTRTTTDLHGWLCIFCDIMIETSYKKMKGFTSGCRKCDKISSKKKTLDDYKNVGKDNNIFWNETTQFPKNTGEPSNGFYCINGHILVNIRYKDIRDGRGCLTCSGRKRKELEDYQNLAKTKDCEYILNTCPSNVDEMCVEAWQCKNGHKPQNATYHSIQKSKYGCRGCAGNKQKDMNDYIRLGIEKGFTFIVNEIPENTTTKVVKGWLCNGDNENNEIHEFTRSYHEIRQDAGCQKCNKWRSQDECVKLFERLLNIKFEQNTSPKFLGGKLQLDGYNEKYNIGIEYNGEHHYKLIEHFHTREQFINQRYNDYVKSELCQLNGTLLFTVPYKYNYRNKKAMEEFIEKYIEYNFEELLEIFENINKV